MNGQGLNRHMDDEVNRRVDTTKIRFKATQGFWIRIKHFYFEFGHKSKKLMIQVLCISGIDNNVANAHVAHTYVMAYLK